jgi:hypothetical protein
MTSPLATSPRPPTLRYCGVDGALRASLRSVRASVPELAGVFPTTTSRTPRPSRTCGANRSFAFRARSYAASPRLQAARPWCPRDPPRHAHPTLSSPAAVRPRLTLIAVGGPAWSRAGRQAATRSTRRRSAPWHPERLADPRAGRSSTSSTLCRACRATAAS